MDGYEHVFNIREKKRGGGVSLFVSNDIYFNARVDLTMPKKFNCVAIEISKDQFKTNKNIIISIVYRPPDTSVVEFIECYQAILSTVQTENKYMITMGDYNINTLKCLKTPTQNRDRDEFGNLLSSFSYQQLIDKPTRFSRTQSTLIDNIYTNYPLDSEVCTSGIICSDITDHFPIFTMISKFCIKDLSRKTITRRNLKKENFTKCKTQLMGGIWDPIYNMDCPQYAFSYFQSTFLEAFNTNFPLETVDVNYKNNHTWITKSLAKSIKTKNELYYAYIADPTEINNSKYKSYKNKLNTILRNQQRKFYSDQLELHRSNPLKSWKIMKQVLGKQSKSITNQPCFNIKGKTVNDASIIANSFNDYFVSVGPTLADKIEISDLSDPLSNVQMINDSITIPYVNESEIISVIKSLKNSSAGYDGIPASIAKQLINSYIKPLSYLINKSISGGIFPTELKLAKVIPVFKSGPSTEISNYRPISVLSFFSKIFEKVLYNHLIIFIDKHNILYKFQFGFRKGHSTQQALITLVHKLTKALDIGDHVIGVYLDLKKAFDTVDHDILLRKLYKYGIRGNVWHLIKSYLCNRSQYVSYNTQNSSTKGIQCGVPQGSILGPLFFIIYINDLSNVSQKIFSILFADDTNIFIQGNNLPQLIHDLQTELSTLVDWLNTNKLTINLAKTYFMIFHKSRHKETSNNLKLELNGKCIEEVQEIKFLGVVIDNDLSWQSHISYIKTKISKSLGVIYRAKKSFNKKALLNLYYAYVFPYYMYCVEIWGNAKESYLNPLIKLQKRSVRIITHSHYRSHTEPLFFKLDILPFGKLVQYRISLTMFKFHHGQVPDSISSIFQLNSDVHSYNTRRKFALRSFRGNHEFIYNTFSFQAVYIWNEISRCVSTNVSFPKFKKISKAYIQSHQLLMRLNI